MPALCATPATCDVLDACTRLGLRVTAFLPCRIQASFPDKLDYLRSYVSSAAQAVLAKGNSVPGLPGYTLGERRTEYDGHSIWTLHDGTKRDDSSAVSIFIFDSPGNRDRRSILPLARNAFRKLRTLRHPDVLRFIDGHESEAQIYIVTEPVLPLTARIGTEGQSPGQGDEWKVWGLSRVVTALKFINSSGASTHGNLRPSSIFISPSGEWKLGGFEVLSSMKDPQQAVLYTQGGLLPDSGRFSSPEVRKSGWDSLKDLDPSALDAYQLYLLIYILFNGPLPSSFISDPNPSLPNARGSIPTAIFPSQRRLGNPNPRARLKVEAFWELGMGQEGGGGQQGAGFFRSNRLVKLAEGLEGFALASEGDRAVLVRTIKDASESLPPEFIRYKVLPSLVKAFEFGPGGPSLLPLILSLGNALPPNEYTASITQPLVRMFATPDRAMRMALLEGLPNYVEKLDQKTVSDKIWPHLVGGFSDVVPVIREATVKSVLLLAPKLTDRLLNNDLLRYLAKTQTDTEAGIRTNTCILLGRLSKFLQPATSRKVLVPAFARALRDPFVHARIAGLMSLMATVDVFEKEDLAARVIPAMSICLVDKEKIVRQQAFKAIDMFIKKTESLTASMPDTVLPPEEQGLGSTTSGGNANMSVAVNKGQPGLAESAGGAAVALAGWAFTSLSSRLGQGELGSGSGSNGAPMDLQRKYSTQSVNGTASEPSLAHAQPTTSFGRPGGSGGLAGANGLGSSGSTSASTSSLPALGASAPRSSSISSSVPGFEAASGDWGGDLMDVEADEGDFDEFESALPAPPSEPAVHPRFTITKKAAPASPSRSMGGKGMKLGGGGSGGHAASRLGGSGSGAGGSAARTQSILKEIQADEGGAGEDWSFDAAAGAADVGAADDDGDWGASIAKETLSNPSSGRSTPVPVPVPAAASSSMSGTAGLSASVPASAGAGSGKDKLQQMKEARQARLAAAKEKKNTLGAKKL